MADDAPLQPVSRIGYDLPVVPMTVYLFDGKGGVREVDPAEANRPASGKGFLAVAGNSGTPEFRLWLRDELGEGHAETMTAPDGRARCTVVDDRATLVLRVARREADPDDIKRQPLTVWIEKGRIIISSRAHLPELFGIAQWQQSHHAPTSPADFVARMGARASDRLEPLVEHVGDVLDELEEEIIDGGIPELSAKLTRTRRTIIALRRMIWPQRDVLNTLEIEELSFFTEWDRARLREATARTTRLGEELQSLSERAALVHEQINDTRGERMNRTMLVLASVTVVAMPMTVVSGLLGMNVAGIPFAQSPEAFWFVVVGLAGIGAAMVWFMHARKWL
ncbi:MAG: CorA family divalent cation transporter [Devosia sp.]|nr:CorA family divalent cation transporter [Devosia sp.]